MSEEQKIRVVIADDQELVRAGFAMVIGSQPDMTVVGQARDGAEAVALAETLLNSIRTVYQGNAIIGNDHTNLLFFTHTLHLIGIVPLTARNNPLNLPEKLEPAIETRAAAAPPAVLRASTAVRSRYRHERHR